MSKWERLVEVRHQLEIPIDKWADFVGGGANGEFADISFEYNGRNYQVILKETALES